MPSGGLNFERKFSNAIAAVSSTICFSVGSPPSSSISLTRGMGCLLFSTIARSPRATRGNFPHAEVSLFRLEHPGVDPVDGLLLDAEEAVMGVRLAGPVDRAAA